MGSIEKSSEKFSLKQCLHEGVIAPMVYEIKAWGMRRAEIRKFNVLKTNCLRSLVGVSEMDLVRNE